MQLDLNEDNIQHIEKVSNFELKSLYANCKVFLFPSLFEGFGFPILEAFSFGKQVVTSNYGATKEISGDLAVLVDPKSVESIANGISKAILEDNQSELRIKHCANYSWKKNARKVRELYLAAIEEQNNN